MHADGWLLHKTETDQKGDIIADTLLNAVSFKTTPKRQGRNHTEIKECEFAIAIQLSIVHVGWICIHGLYTKLVLYLLSKMIILFI